jgi:transposase
VSAPADTAAPLCRCGCGEPVTRKTSGTWNRFLPGHSGRMNRGDYALDAECARRVHVDGMSVREAGESLGISGANVHMRVRRHERRTGAVVAPERKKGERVPWPERVERLPRTGDEWQTLGRPDWDRAETVVRGLSGLYDVRHGGEWLFRRVKAARGRAEVQARWLGAPCPNCGATSELAATCPLCGYDKASAP